MPPMTPDELALLAGGDRRLGVLAMVVLILFVGQVLGYLFLRWMEGPEDGR